MPSAALQALHDALTEVAELTNIASELNRTNRAIWLRQLRVLGRSQVVLISSHFERYLYSINEEAISFVNSKNIENNRIPPDFKLLHSAAAIDALALTAWLNRTDGLTRFVSTDGWLWSSGRTGNLIHDRLLVWMKAPNSPNLIRYYRYWSINDVFSTITRKTTTRNLLFYHIQELVDKRNSIAHGDVDAQATRLDVLRYVKSVKTFCDRADRALGKTIGRVVGDTPPW